MTGDINGLNKTDNMVFFYIIVRYTDKAINSNKGHF